MDRIRIVYPENRFVTPEQLIVWARDDIANGDSAVFSQQENVLTLEDAILVLNDSGSVTVTKQS